MEFSILPVTSLSFSLRLHTLSLSFSSGSYFLFLYKSFYNWIQLTVTTASVFALSLARTHTHTRHRKVKWGGVEQNLLSVNGSLFPMFVLYCSVTETTPESRSSSRWPRAIILYKKTGMTPYNLHLFDSVNFYILLVKLLLYIYCQFKLNIFLKTVF